MSTGGADSRSGQSRRQVGSRYCQPRPRRAARARPGTIGLRGHFTKKLASEKRQKSTASRIVNCQSRRSTPRRLRYTDESPPNVAERPDPRACIRMDSIRKMPSRSWPKASAGFTVYSNLVVASPESGPAHGSTAPRHPGWKAGQSGSAPRLEGVTLAAPGASGRLLRAMPRGSRSRGSWA